MVLKSNCILSLAFALIITSVAIRAEEDLSEIPQTKPYVPSDDNQLLSLGAPKGERFKLKDITWPAKVGNAEVCLWKDDKYAAASITIDDNCFPDQAWWLEQCKKHGIKVTWFVITGGVDKTNIRFNGTWEGYQKLLDAGHAVESHTHNHKRTSKATEEFTRAIYAGSQYALNSKLKGNRNLTMAYPMGDGNPKIAGEYFIAVRGTNGMINPANCIDYLNTNKGAILQPYIDVLLTGHTDSKKYKWLNKRDQSNKRGWIAPLYHYIPRGRSKEEKEKNKRIAEEQVANLASYKDRIWIDTFTAVMLYAQERDSAILKTISSNNNKIELSLKDCMKDDIFNYPLTIKVRLPDAWKNVQATQQEKEVGVKFIEHEGKPYALVQGVPDKGSIILSAK